MDVTERNQNPPFERLTVRDLIWLVVACAVALQTWIMGLNFEEAEPASLWFDYHQIKLFEWLTLINLLLVAWAWMIVLRGVVGPPSRRTQAGTVACLSVVVASFFCSLDIYLTDAEPMGFLRLPIWHRAILVYTCIRPGMLSFHAASVATGWLLVVWTIGWRRSAGPLDSLGRVIGCWCLFMPLAWPFWLHHSP